MHASLHFLLCYFSYHTLSYHCATQDVNGHALALFHLTHLTPNTQQAN